MDMHFVMDMRRIKDIRVRHITSVTDTGARRITDIRARQIADTGAKRITDMGTKRITDMGVQGTKRSTNTGKGYETHFDEKMQHHISVGNLFNILCLQIEILVCKYK